MNAQERSSRHVWRRRIPILQVAYREHHTIIPHPIPAPVKKLQAFWRDESHYTRLKPVLAPCCPRRKLIDAPGCSQLKAVAAEGRSLCTPVSPMTASAQDPPQPRALRCGRERKYGERQGDMTHLLAAVGSPQAIRFARPAYVGTRTPATWRIECLSSSASHALT